MAWTVSRSGSPSFRAYHRLSCVQEDRLSVSDDKPLFLVEEPGTGLQYIEGRFKEKGAEKEGE